MWTLLLTAFIGSAQADTPISTLDDAPRTRFEEAEAAWALGELDEADLAFQDVLAAVPDFDRAWRRRCGVLLAMGDAETAADLCREAVSLNNSFENRTALALSLLQIEGAAVEAKRVIDSVTSEQPDYLEGWVALCTWAVTHERADPLSTCTDKLEAMSPDTPGTLYFRSMQQAQSGDTEAAAATLRVAREKGLQDALTQQAVVAIARINQQEGGPSARKGKGKGKEAKPEESSWSLGDLVPLLIAGGLALAVGVLAFGDNEEEEDEDTPSEPPANA